MTHLSILLDAARVVLLEGDVLLINRDQFWMQGASDSFTGVPLIGLIVFTRFAA